AEAQIKANEAQIKVVEAQVKFVETQNAALKDMAYDKALTLLKSQKELFDQERMKYMSDMEKKTQDEIEITTNKFDRVVSALASGFARQIDIGLRKLIQKHGIDESEISAMLDQAALYKEIDSVLEKD